MHRLSHFAETYNSCLRPGINLLSAIESDNDRFIPIPDFVVVSALHGISHILYPITSATQPTDTLRI
jgi:hypothetical protein